VGRILVLTLVLSLSGVPAAGVVCDLVLCRHLVKTAAARAGCHDHGQQPPVTQITKGADGDCAHLAAADPAVGAMARFVTRMDIAMLPMASLPEATVTQLRIERPLAHGPPPAAHRGSYVPLRI
jgi:hypothetical protein